MQRQGPVVGYPFFWYVEEQLSGGLVGVDGKGHGIHCQGNAGLNLIPVWRLDYGVAQLDTLVSCNIPHTCCNCMHCQIV